MPMYVFCLLLCCFGAILSVGAQPNAPVNCAEKRLLVVSGGGARGAWAVGLIERLHKQQGYCYPVVVGTSTGALMAPLIVLNEFDTLATGYTSVTQRDIFNKNPFRRNGELSLWRAIFRLGKPSLGESLPLREQIRRFMTPAVFERIRSSPDGLNFGVAVVNLRTQAVTYQYARQNSYDDMVNWMWASANQPVFMSPYITTNANGTQDFWVDGGVRDNVPVTEGLRIALADESFTAVDVVVNNVAATSVPSSAWPLDTRSRKANLLSVLLRTVDTYGNGTRELNLTVGALLNELSGRAGRLSADAAPTPDGLPLSLNFYFMTSELFNLIPNELLFNKATMTQLLEAGRRGVFVSGNANQPLAAADSARVAPGQNPVVVYSFQLSRTALSEVLQRLSR